MTLIGFKSNRDHNLGFKIASCVPAVIGDYQRIQEETVKYAPRKRPATDNTCRDKQTHRNCPALGYVFAPGLPVGADCLRSLFGPQSVS